MPSQPSSPPSWVKGWRSYILIIGIALVITLGVLQRNDVQRHMIAVGNAPVWEELAQDQKRPDQDVGDASNATESPKDEQEHFAEEFPPVDDEGRKEVQGLASAGSSPVNESAPSTLDPRVSVRKEANRIDALTEELLSRPAPQTSGWVKAMFDSMDEDKDGMVTIDELHKFATNMQLPEMYFKDFARITAQRENRTVYFQDFITTIRAREMAMNKACQPYETESHQSVYAEALGRGQWLLGLMVVQSLSGIILQSFESLIQSHMVVTFFLTMLIGAGGNAGNQSTIKIIEGMASGDIDISWSHFVGNMINQLSVGFYLAVMMTVAGFIRVLITNGLTRIEGPGHQGWELSETGFKNCAAISASLFMIVIVSCIAGTFLPFAFVAIGVEAANAGPTLQVMMDIIGVIITCTTCTFILNASPISAFFAKVSLPSLSIPHAFRATKANYQEMTSAFQEVEKVAKEDSKSEQLL
eukprot:CAMPEP_0114237800 /NCGR_PEP_ID=MMETSP0058-20121206/7584_1 /TAXON_ID=36894 /ORGANISM="Pyramimonas parkeae, CCMP726" /LENGTH=470 /DNA_ID=CAMNT_0001349867 /DNA_START=108 /DNA_END=1523 /DNA_ORIENTATION=+